MKTVASTTPTEQISRFPHSALALRISELGAHYPGRWNEHTLAAAEILDPERVLDDEEGLAATLDAIEAVTH